MWQIFLSKGDFYDRVCTCSSAEIMQAISIVSFIVGICLVGVGLIFLFLNKKKGKEKKATALWIVIGVGVLLIINHGIQLLF